MSMPNDVPAFLTTQQAAAALGVTQRRVVALIQAGRLKASRLGRDWLIPAQALEAVRERKPGRPRQSRAEIESR
ncbi:MAG: helix-turn-helix domain-containing protein [Candidatus Entotheonellia bacterium]